MNYILGIDQGGTKTAAALMDETGSISGLGYAKGAYFPHQGMEAAVSEMVNAANAALAQAGIGTDAVTKIIAGVSGVDYPGDDTAVQEALAEKFGQKDIRVYNDCVIALYDDRSKSYGAGVCAGTRLNAAICKKDGKCFVFGDYLGEELQGSIAIAQRGIRAVFDADLGIGHAEKLTELFLRFSGLKTVGSLLRTYIQDSDFRIRIRHVVPEMMALANSGDRAADQIIRQFAEDLCVYLIAGLQKTFLPEESVNIVLAGSVFKGNDNPFIKYLTQAIHAAAPNALIMRSRYEPVVGACIMGALQTGDFTAEMSQNLSDSAKKHFLVVPD